MLLKPICIGLMPPGRVGDVFIELLARRNVNANFVEPCPYPIKKDHYPLPGFRAPYVANAMAVCNKSFRLIPWHEHLDLIDEMTTEYAPKNIWLGTWDLEIFEKAKESIDCTSFSINYSADDYDLVKRKWARCQTGAVMELEQHAEYRAQFNNDPALVEQHLLNNDGSDFGHVIPKSFYAPADVEINLRDIFDQEKFLSILDCLDVRLTGASFQYYTEYLKVSG